jgi:Uncharacterized conserved protein
MAWSRRRVLALIAGALVVHGSGAARAEAREPQAFARSKVEILTQAGARHVFAVEVATSDEQLAQGLMHRRSLAADAGMLFDFGVSRPVSMWMKNTLIPLDMVFLAADGTVVGVAERAVPGSLEIISAPVPVRGVLEVNGGTVSRLGIRRGDRLVHPLFGGGN